MFLDLFIVPRNRVINEPKATRTVKSSKGLVKQYWQATSWKQINETQKTALYYGVVYDNEWFDHRLIKDLHSVLLLNMNIDMFSLFCARGDGKVVYEPRVFRRELLLDPHILHQPLPVGHRQLKFEKLIGGWLYVD